MSNKVKYWLLATSLLFVGCEPLVCKIGVVQEVGGCDRSGICGTIVSVDGKVMQDTRYYPVKGGSMRICLSEKEWK